MKKINFIYKYLLLLTLFIPQKLDSMAIAPELLIKCSQPILMMIMGHLSSKNADISTYGINLESESIKNLEVAREIYCRQACSDAIRVTFPMQSKFNPQDILSAMRFTLPARFDDREHIREILSRFNFSVNLDTYSESELHEQLLMKKLTYLKMKELLENPSAMRKAIAEAMQEKAQVITENSIHLSRYQKIFEQFLVMVDSRNFAPEVRAEAILTAPDLIDNIEDPSVKKIFKQALENVLFDCCDRNECCMDLCCPQQNSKKHLVRCLRELTEDKAILNRLKGQPNRFIFSNFDLGMQDIKKRYKFMQNLEGYAYYNASHESVDSQRFKKHLYHEKINSLLSALKRGRFDQARQVIDRISNYGNQKLIANQLYNSVYRKTFNEFGIFKALENDPLWAQLPHESKLEVKSNSKLQKIINGVLAEREQSGASRACVESPENKLMPCGLSEVKSPELEELAEDKVNDINYADGKTIPCGNNIGPKEELKDCEVAETLEEPVTECNSSKIGNLPSLSDPAESSSTSEDKNENPDVEFMPAIEIDNIDLDQLPEKDRRRFIKKVAKVINDINHNPELKEQLESLQEVVDKFNNSEEAKRLGIWLDLETIYHVLHGHIRKGKITGCHSAELDCCFEFVEKTSESNDVLEGSVRIKDHELRKFVKDKPSTTVFSPKDKIETILEDILEATRNNSILDDRVKPNQIKRVIKLQTKRGNIIEITVNNNTGFIESFYPIIKRWSAV